MQAETFTDDNFGGAKHVYGPGYHVLKVNDALSSMKVALAGELDGLQFAVLSLSLSLTLLLFLSLSLSTRLTSFAKIFGNLPKPGHDLV